MTIEVENTNELPRVPMRSYSLCTQAEAVAAFARAFGREPEAVYVWRNSFGQAYWMMEAR